MKQTFGNVQVSILTGGEGYSMPDNSLVEVALFSPPTAKRPCLPSQVGLSKQYDPYWDGNEEHGGVAPYLSMKVAMRLLTDLERLHGGKAPGSIPSLILRVLDTINEEVD